MSGDEEIVAWKDDDRVLDIEVELTGSGDGDTSSGEVRYSSDLNTMSFL